MADRSVAEPLVFDASVIHWRGPSPFFFAPIPLTLVDDIRAAARRVSYGWGMIPVEASIEGIGFVTSLFPKDDTYLLPLKDAVRRSCGITAGDQVQVEMTIRARR